MTQRIEKFSRRHDRAVSVVGWAMAAGVVAVTVGAALVWWRLEDLGPLGVVIAWTLAASAIGLVALTANHARAAGQAFRRERDAGCWWMYRQHLQVGRRRAA